jgi:hypothetical protein
MTTLFNNLLGGFAKSVALGQLRTYLPAIGGGLTVLGIQNQVSAAGLEGAIYYLVNASFVVVPAIFSYLQKKNVATLVTAAIAAEPGSPEAASVLAKVS